MKPSYWSIASAFILIGLLAGPCRAQNLTTTEKGVIGGAVLGAGTGAIVGAGVHHPGKGALIGGGLGAVAGGVVGHELENQENAQRQLQGEVSAQQRQIDYQRAEIRQLQQEQRTSTGSERANLDEVTE